MKRGFVLVMLAAVSTFAQQVTETVNVEVVQVPVYVYAPDGTPLRGLKKNAFELWINGFPKPIEYFDAVDVSVGVPADSPRPERQRRLYLLLFDLSCSRGDCQGLAGRIARAQRAAGLAVERSNLSSDLFAVGTYTSNRGVQLATPFLRDRVAVRRAINTLAASTAHDPLGLTISSGERAAWLKEQTTDVSDEATAMLNSRYNEASREIVTSMIGGIANQDNVREPSKKIIDDQLSNFAALAERLSTLEGQKHVVLFSQGFSSELIHGGPGLPDPNGATGLDGSLMARLRTMFDTFQTSGVFLDAIDILGVRGTSGSFNNDSLQFLAHGTGGEFVKNRNNFTTAFLDLTKRQEVVYLLGFDRRDMQWGKIDVRTQGLPRGTRVSFRRGFGAPASGREIDSLQLADIIVNDQPQTGVSMAMAIRGQSVLVAIARSEVLPQIVESEPWIETILYVFDRSGAAILSRQKRVTFDAELRKASGPIVIGQKLELAPGDYTAKAITRIGGTSSVGFAKMEFTVAAE